ncbi:hypothetical protein IFM89_000244 [Coptis chinensis]|uniref:DYW domain-containing protein n=1 Tax=Coptis chinensis TaxID=261450 RepID=A0A835M3C0_9MAGN|nr:hypothetical protein IFM89_000244 [Coptis chinensis]
MAPYSTATLICKSPTLFRSVPHSSPTPFSTLTRKTPSAIPITNKGFNTCSPSSCFHSHAPSLNYSSHGLSFNDSGRSKFGFREMGFGFFGVSAVGNGGVGGNGKGGFGDGSSGGSGDDDGGKKKWSLLSWYLAALETYPVFTKALTSAILTCVGDLICQLVIDRVSTLDVKRTFLFTLLGFVIVGPTLHFWYLSLSKMVATPGASGAFLRLLLDQFLFSPIFIGFFLCTLLTLEGRPSQIVPKLQQVYHYCYPGVVGNSVGKLATVDPVSVPQLSICSTAIPGCVGIKAQILEDQNGNDLGKGSASDVIGFLSAFGNDLGKGSASDVIGSLSAFGECFEYCITATSSQLGALSLGRWAHDYVVERGLDVNVILGTSLVNMYARCGNVGKAREVFNGMPVRNVMTWTSMISGYGMHGYGKEAIELFHQMRTCGPRPNDVTFIAVLSACAHVGLVEKGREVLTCMKQMYGLVPRVEHHVCMVDMLGRAGFLNEAFQYIEESFHGKPPAAVCTAMLGACKMHKKYELGVQVAEHLLTIEPDNPGHYVLLSNIYALAGRMDRVEVIRKLMRRKGLKKQVGYTVIEVNNVSHMFCLGDTSHPHTAEIYKYLENLMWKCKQAGYIPETDSMMHDLEEEEREFALRFHSEKLAIAFGLMKTSQGSTIRIIKNLRMCDDCHSTIKFISIVTCREIIVRDKHRFHHFTEGSCSCLDYW